MRGSSPGLAWRQALVKRLTSSSTKADGIDADALGLLGDVVVEAEFVAASHESHGAGDERHGLHDARLDPVGAAVDSGHGEPVVDDSAEMIEVLAHGRIGGLRDRSP